MNARSASSLTPNQLGVMALDSAEGKLLQGLSTARQKSIARRELARRWRFSEKQLNDALQKLTLRGMVRSNRGRVQITSAGVDVVESALAENPDRELSTTAVGELVLERLKKLDKIAYVRFASVYRDFQDAESFLVELKDLFKDGK